MKTNGPEINLADYQYDLPEDRIAQFPLKNREDAKLLVYDKGNITHHRFYDLVNRLPSSTFLLFNNTKVIPARIYLQRASGARIEIVLISPHHPREVVRAMQARETCQWTCLVGNKKRWKDGETLRAERTLAGQTYTLEANWIDRAAQILDFRWKPSSLPFPEILEAFGNMPLPPYLKREAQASDQTRYQTLYSKEEGAVAAPTAGLHFTKEVLHQLEEKGIRKDFVTLHVSGATFQPLKTDSVTEHPMHAEQITFSRDTVQHLLHSLGKIIPVGTTSLRVLESLYWYGVKILEKKESTNEKQEIPFHIEKLYPYRHRSETLPSPSEALEAVRSYMQARKMNQCSGETEIFIFPGYTFQLTSALVTNFHMPHTTLILLVAAFIGEDWRQVYQAALDNQYRFLSYGDSSLLIPKS